MILTTSSPTYDAVIVGARCAGAATAMLLARAGLRVLAVDRAPEGADTLSTHALMRGGVLQLHRWGLLGALAEAGTPAVRSATFHYGDDAVAVAVKPRDGVDALYAPRRTVIDPLLARAAAEAGAEVEFGATALDLVRGPGGRVEGVVLAGPGGGRRTVRAARVVGADGLRSRVAALAGAPVERRGAHASAVVYGHWEGLPVDGYHWYYRPGVGAGAIPTNDGRTCVFVAVPPERLRGALPGGLPALYRAAAASASPVLADALRGARLVGKLHPFPGARGALRRAAGPGWALVGDAGYFKDPLTAHGMTDALRDAELLARAMARGTDGALEEYQATRDALSAELFEVTDRIASFEWDLDEARRLHQALARAMAAESDALVRLGGEIPAPATGRPRHAAQRVPSAAAAPQLRGEALHGGERCPPRETTSPGP